MDADQLKWDLRWLNMAKMVASWSKDPSTQTGAVIVRGKNEFVSLGYNGFPKSMPDKPENYSNREEKYSRIVHCEMNALLFAKEDVKGCTLYTWPFISCDRCFVHMVQAGLTRFVAPMANEDQLSRWGTAMERVRSYAKEVNVEIIELNIPNI
jgi:dCMP deaminase